MGVRVCTFLPAYVPDEAFRDATKIPAYVTAVKGDLTAEMTLDV